jgi:hypothetical protein
MGGINSKKFNQHRLGEKIINKTVLISHGAGDGDRTRIISLEG